MTTRTRALDLAGRNPAKVTNAKTVFGATLEPPKYVTEKCFSQEKSELSANFSAPDVGANRPVTKPKKPRKPGRKAPSEAQLRLAKALYHPDPEKVLRGGSP